MISRKKTRAIKVGTVGVGGVHPISVQSMLKTDPDNFQQTLEQVRELKKVGCEIIRIALPRENTCKIVPFLKQHVDMPVIGDIHFNHTIALRAMEAGIDGIRINPGTINNVRKVREVAVMARQTGTPIRIGINVGSIEKRILRKYRKADAAAMVESAFACIALFEDEGHRELKVSLKASDISQTVEAYRLFARKSDYPLHLGLTEAGPVFSGSIKSTLGIGILLNEGIGDTIRVSLTGNPVYEVMAGFIILRGLGLRKKGINLISCPTCGRCKVDIKDIVGEFERECAPIEMHLNVAIMGCEVNGPGEAREADVGIAFGAQKAVLFSKGVVKKRNIPKDLAKDALLEEIHNLTQNQQ